MPYPLQFLKGFIYQNLLRSKPYTLNHKVSNSQTVCKGYQQTTKVIASKERVLVNCLLLFRRTIMTNAVKNTEAMVVVSQENMLEKLQHSEVITVVFIKFWHNVLPYLSSTGMSEFDCIKCSKILSASCLTNSADPDQWSIPCLLSWQAFYEFQHFIWEQKGKRSLKF